MRPDKSKLEAVANFPAPKTKRQVRAFLRLTGYYRRFIPTYCLSLQERINLTECSGRRTVRNHLHCSKGLSVQSQFCGVRISSESLSDASDRGIGAVLSQCDDAREEHPVAFYSPPPRDARYSTIEKERLAIKAATHAFRVYLLGRKFIFQTDHRALEWLNRLKDNNHTVESGATAIPVHCAGVANGNADGLSRAFLDPTATSSPEKEGVV